MKPRSKERREREREKETIENTWYCWINVRNIIYRKEVYIQQQKIDIKNIVIFRWSLIISQYVLLT